MAQAKQVKFRLLYAGVNITQDITPYIISINYNDCLEGESDDVSFVFADPQGLWRDSWYPTKKDKVKLWLGYADLEIFCGTFTVDEIEMSGPPDIVTMKALAAASNSPLRTKKNRQFDGVTLRQIAQKIADENGLTLIDGAQSTQININFDKERAGLTAAASKIRTAAQGRVQQNYVALAAPVYASLADIAESIIIKGYPDEGNEILAKIKIAAGLYFGGSLPDYNSAKAIVTQFANRLDQIASQLQNRSFTRTKSQLDDIQIESLNQYETTDLAFLYKLGMEYGIVFSVRDTDLVFTSLFDLDAADNITKISRKSMVPYSIKDTLTGTYKKSNLSYHNPGKNETVSHEAEVGSDPDSPELEESATNEDTLELRVRAENDQQAEKKSKVALHRANSAGRTGSGTLMGNPLLMAGVNFELLDAGKLSGKYQVTKSGHSIAKSGGYSVSIEFKGVDKKPPGSSGTTKKQPVGTDPQGVYGKALTPSNLQAAREYAQEKTKKK